LSHLLVVQRDGPVELTGRSIAKHPSYRLIISTIGLCFFQNEVFVSQPLIHHDTLPLGIEGDFRLFRN
jgi:hypothetical protein